jgi:glutamate receptor, ionotropic, invertebrate
MNIHHSINLETPIRCNDQDSIFLNGTSIFNSMKTIPPFNGLSGRIQFNQLGNRENFELEVFELASDGVKVIGTWDPTDKLKLISEEKPETKEIIDIFKQRPLKILTKIKNAPYAMIKNTTLILTGNNQYEGYVIELIEKLAMRIGFNYTFIDQPSFGRIINEDPIEYDGMMGDLMNDRADLAIADLTITSERESIVDFTMPFMG